ncbi:DNA polymerase Y family protein [Terriglobus albidus]|nr:DNA polymerase Y family protein [Terriglobus albidus]
MGRCTMNSGELYACLLVKEFSAQALLRLRPELREKPCVVLDGEPPAETVCSLNTRARLLGVQRGMTKVEVDTFGNITMLSRSRSAEAASKTALLECAGTYSPRVELQEEENVFLCCLDITGTEALFGPPEVLARSLRQRVALLGISAQVAVSGNFHTSMLLAKGLPARTAIVVVPTAQESAALASLPLSVLGISEVHAETLSRWGIRTLGMLAGLPQTDLIARLGQDGKRLQQMATGTLPHLFQPIDIPFVLEETAELDYPLDNLESLLFGVAIMLEQLIVRAAMRVYALASVTIELHLEGGRTHCRTVSPRIPTNDKHLWLKLLHLDLEAHPANAPIDKVCLRAEPGATSKVQLGLFSPQLPEPGRLDVTLARITALVGDNNIGRAVLDDTHTSPGFHMEPFVIPSGNATTQISRTAYGCLRRVCPPEQLTITLESGRPSGFFFRGHRYTVRNAYGPWLAGGEWWNEQTWRQEQWDLIARGDDESMLYGCVLQDLIHKSWLLVGLYD